MPKLTKKAIYIFIAAVVALYLVIAVIPTLTGKLTPTQTVEYGELKVSDDVKAYIVRDETVYTASDTGTVSYKVKEGDLIKRGAVVISFAASGEKGENGPRSRYGDILRRLGHSGVPTGNVSLRKGVISYYVDGYENKMTPALQSKLTENDVTAMEAEPSTIMHDQAVKGDPLFKIYNNAKWYMNVWVDDSKTEKYQEGDSVKVELGNETVKAVITDIIAEGDKWHIIIETNRYWSNLGMFRAADAKLVTVDREGLIIDNSCITTKDKKIGVYVETTTGSYVFRRINIIARSDGRSLVSSGTFTDEHGNTVETVNVYDEILKNPKEG